jgi:hypothetical protein
MGKKHATVLPFPSLFPRLNAAGVVSGKRSTFVKFLIGPNHLAAKSEIS